ncbi:phosphatase PAP2 family protein [Chryseobacterium sp. Mn2064]|uniref:phosphatase PAP2 family protein n=1 Tax=Chryseobacterium sp. Mn2064 TaxID=3395263 RepID=UPI003BE2EC87
MDEKRLTIQQKFFALLLCSIIFMMVYNFAAWYTSTLATVPSLVFDFEKYIPFIPWSIIPYMTSGLFFCTVFFFCKEKEQLVVLTRRMLFVTFAAGLCFVLFPLRFSFSKPEIDNHFLQYSFQFLKTFDSPFNQAPSLHITYAFIFWSVFRELKKFRIFLMIALLLLGISTLTTYQHHVIDIVTGSILAHLSFIVFPFRKNNILYRNFHVANVYFFSGWILILMTLSVKQLIGPSALIILWPAFIIFLVGFHYQKNNIYFLKNRAGNISWIKKILYFPYIIIYRIFWTFFRKNKAPVQIFHGLYISSRPNAEDLKNFTAFAIYDLSAEMEEVAILKENPRYHFIPFLDVGTFDLYETQKLISDITNQYKILPKDGKILIHCTMGFTRSSVIAILVMKNILSLSLEETINTMKTINKNAVIPSYLQDFLKKF